jgi:hypothetical protein
MAPPIPTTTPMTVLFVFGDMLEEEVSLAERPAVPVDFAEDEVSVDEDTEVMTLPETVVKTVTRLTLAEVLVVGVEVEAGVGVSELNVESSVLLDELVGVGMELDDDVDEVVGVTEGVLLAVVLFTVAEAEEIEESDAVVPVPGNPPTGPVVTELRLGSTAFFSTSRSRRFESNQFA